MWGGFRSIAARSLGRVSPVRTPVRMSVERNPRSNASRWISASGPSRFFCMSLDSALRGETYTTSVELKSDPSIASRSSLSMQTRKAASVLPEPVGAEIKVGAPATILGHPWTWGSVGEPNLPRNHSAVIGCAQANSGGICMADFTAFAFCLPIADRKCGYSNDSVLCGARHGTDWPAGYEVGST